jgi:nitrate reductase NapD
MSEYSADEYNVCGVLVHAHKNKTDQVKQLLQQQAGVEVHAVTENGRLVVTVENNKRNTVGDRIMGFYEIPGVLSAAMIYQYSDNDLDVDELSPNPEITNASENKARKERMSA